MEETPNVEELLRTKTRAESQKALLQKLISETQSEQLKLDSIDDNTQLAAQYTSDLYDYMREQSFSERSQTEDKEDDVSIQEETKERAEDIGYWDALLLKLGLIDENTLTFSGQLKHVTSSIKELGSKWKEKLDEDYGLLGKALGAGLDLTAWIGNSLTAVIGPIFKQIGVKGLGVVALAGATIAGTASKLYEMYENGVSATVSKDVATLNERWSKKDFAGMLMNPIDTMTGAFGKLGEELGESIWNISKLIEPNVQSIKDAISDSMSYVADVFDDLMGLFGKAKNAITDRLPKWLGGTSASERQEAPTKKPRETAAQKRERRESEIAAARAAFTAESNKVTTSTSSVTSLTKKELEVLDDASRSTEAVKKTLERKNANTSNVLAQAASDADLEHSKKTALILSNFDTLYEKAMLPERVEVRKNAIPASAPALIEQPPALSVSSAVKKQSQATNTVVVREVSSRGVDVPDYIGSATALAVNMSRR